MKYDRNSEIWIVFDNKTQKWWGDAMGYNVDSYENATPVSWQTLVDSDLVDRDNPIKLPLIIMLHPRVAATLVRMPSITIDLD